MAIVKIPRSDFDAKALAEETFDDSQGYEPYEGPEPRSGLVLAGVVKKVWWTYTQKKSPMFKLIFEAAGNEGDKAQFDGLGIWDQVVFQNDCAFRYQPFAAALGINIPDINTKMNLADEDDNQGAPVIAIGKWRPGDSARCRIVTKREKYQGEWRTKIAKFMPPKEAEEPEEEDEEETARTPRSARSASARSVTPEPEEEEETAEVFEDDPWAEDEETARS